MQWTHVANIYNKEQEPTDINVLQLWILKNTFKIFKIQKDEIRIVLNIVTALQIKKKQDILHFL